MRIMRRFTLPDLEATAEITRSNVDKFVRALLMSGHIRIARPKIEGVKGGHTVYQLVRNTGPYPPRVRKDGSVYDQNTGEVTVVLD
jgi:hypothetical protein